MRSLRRLVAVVTALDAVIDLYAGPRPTD